ncbi:MAG: TIR domain-containing protein, partial [Caulobacterales bacterium]|nr:TIR domain-containing protein [Caulobacterales bacterium]
MGHAFISFASDDRDAADLVEQALAGKGVTAWRYEHKIAAGDIIPLELETAIGSAVCVVLLYSHVSRFRDWVAVEYELAVKHAKPLLIVRLDDQPLDDERFPGISEFAYLDGKGEHELMADAVARRAGDWMRRHCPVIGFMNVKGGVGKTTLAANIAA